ncbi:MAG: ATP-dependent Clp protease ATP-binding subunit ClpA, partial [Bacillariaceae sp.]
TSNRGDFERKMKNLIKEASENNVILFIGMYFKCVCVCVCVCAWIYYSS